MSNLIDDLAYQDKRDYEEQNGKRDEELNKKLEQLLNLSVRYNDFSINEIKFLSELRPIDYFNVWSNYDIEKLKSVYSHIKYG